MGVTFACLEPAMEHLSQVSNAASLFQPKPQKCFFFFSFLFLESCRADVSEATMLGLNDAHSPSLGQGTALGQGALLAEGGGVCAQSL